MGVITRWGSNMMLFKKLQLLKSEIISVVTDVDASDYVSDELQEICLSQQFWSDLSSTILFLEPLVQAVALLEGDKSISNVLKVC